MESTEHRLYRLGVNHMLNGSTETLDGMSGGARNQRVAPQTPKSEYRFVKGDAEHCHVAMGFPSYGASHPDRMAASMLSAVLGSGTSSRLFQNVREKKALVYSIYTTVSQNSDASSIASYMSCTDGNVIEAMETVASVISGFLREGLEKGELERAKRSRVPTSAAWSRRSTGCTGWGSTICSTVPRRPWRSACGGSTRSPRTTS